MQNWNTYRMSQEGLELPQTKSISKCDYYHLRKANARVDPHRVNSVQVTYTCLLLKLYS